MTDAEKIMQLVASGKEYIILARESRAQAFAFVQCKEFDKAREALNEAKTYLDLAGKKQKQAKELL